MIVANDSSQGTRAFEGDIAALPVPELLQFLHISGRDGVLVITDDSGRPRAVIHYVGTAIVHAACDGVVGRAAVFSAITFSSGRFEFFAGRVTHRERTVDENVQNLILEGQIIDSSDREEQEVRSVLVGLLAADLIVDRRDDSYLDAIIPRHLRQEEVGEMRYAPPTLVANLLLQVCDGHLTARQLMQRMRMDERPFFDELKLLVRTRWVGFAVGGDVFERVGY